MKIRFPSLLSSLILMKKKILFLPDAGHINPFQVQLVRFLEESGLEVNKAPSRRFFATWRAVNKYRPDVVYFDWIQSFIIGKNLPITLLKCLTFSLEILYLTKIKRIPVLHTLHNLRNHAKRQVGMERWMYRFFLKRCSRVRIYSETTRVKARRLFGIDTSRFMVIQDIPFHYYYRNTSTVAESRQFLKLDESAFVYLFLGMVKPYKGLEDLVAAFKQVKDTELRLIIVGMSDSPAYAQTIQELVKEDRHIKYHNQFVADEQVQYYLNAADVMVLPFRNIEHSSSIDLALSFRKPIITRRTPFLERLLQHQREILFANPTDLPETLRTAKQEKEKLRKIGEQNFAIANQSNFREFKNFFML